ncbi:MAG TPA: glycosyltransferase family 39 protein [Pyrinomonadaceae bacterium]|jgi:4-amino-4-deoxy-L-arabinose transferase-like glycosyltransferase
MSENTTARIRDNNERWFWVAFFTLALFVFFFGLNIPLVGPDEPRYAEVAREMFLRGDWVTPTLGGFNWFEKPALLYWLEIVSYHVFGVTEFAARIDSALCGLGTVASLWIAARFRGLGNEASTGNFANWTAMIAASTIGILAFSHGASFDIVVTFPITASLASFCVFDSATNETSTRRKFLALISFYFFIGVGLLAKGLIGVVFPFAIVTFYFLLRRRMPRRDFLVSLFWGIPLLVLVAATWYLPMYLQHGWQFIDEFIIQQHFERFATNKYQHPQPFYFFFWVLPLMTIPWLPFFLWATWKSFRDRISGPLARLAKVKPPAIAGGSDLPFSSSPLRLFSISWLLVPLLFFSFSGSKLPGYILPAVPGAILLTSIYIYQFIQKSPLRSNLVKTVAIGTLVICVIAIIFLVPRFARKESVKSLVAAADASGYATAPVLSYLTVSHNAEYYAAGRLIRDADGKQRRFVGPHELVEYISLHNNTPLVILVPKNQITTLTLSESLQTEVLDDNGELDVAIVRLK